MVGVNLTADGLRGLLDGLDVGVCLLDADATIRYGNRALAAIFGLTADRIVDRPLPDVLPALAQEVDWPRAAANAIDRGRTLRLAKHALPDGIRVDCSLGPVALDGAPGLALLTLADVTETARLEALQLRQARTQAIANLGDSIAHEIRNPLNSIAMNVQLLREGLGADEPDRERLERTAGVVLREIKRLDGVVRDFVQYSRPPALRLEQGSVNHVVRAALDLLDAQIREKGIRIDTDLQSARPVRMDRDRLQRAFYNVLLNAVQVLGEGGVITCRSRDEERRCLVEISDDGPGLDPAKSAHIFEVFYTTKRGGTGLGLPIANRIVEEHGGRVAVASAPGEGATFAFFLPYEGPPPSSEQGPTTVPRGSRE
jgi:PAS domain S-box-containing protein